ncbi:MAG TPA: pilus assembly protein N-terminal domain-containing protein [Myxococcales bacterium]|nr:pilus assembly protein N-terminal domain-containing protein [Myxococcales bacterium]
MLRMRSLAFALTLVAAPAPSQPDGGVIALGVGQQKILQAGDVARVAIGEPEVADVKQVGTSGELLLTGVGEGRTSLLVWRSGGARLSYTVVVRKQDPKELVSEVRALLGDREGVQVRVVGDRVYLEGETLNADDAERVAQILKLYPSVRSFVRPSGNSRRLAAEALNKALQRNGLRGVTASVLGGTLVLEGWVESKEELRKLELLTRGSAEKPESLVTVGAHRMVLVEVDFVEASSGSSKQVGIKPPASFVSTGDGLTASVDVVQPLRGLDSGQTQRSGSVTVKASVASDFSATARFDHGAVRILSQPRLVCASGEKAEFQAGGEVPVLIATQNQFGVEFKKFGILLHVTPSADQSGNISTAIHAEVSDVDRSASVRANGFDVPGFRVREVKTTVIVRDGETIVLSGLYNSSEEKEVSKVPLLGHIPILGELFKSRSFMEHKTELAIYITPRVIWPANEGARQLLDEARKIHEGAEGSVGFSWFD